MSGRAALTYLLVALIFAALGATAVFVCVKVFHLTIMTAGMISMPVSYTCGMLMVWWMARRGQKH